MQCRRSIYVFVFLQTGNCGTGYQGWVATVVDLFSKPNTKPTVHAECGLSGQWTPIMAFVSYWLFCIYHHYPHVSTFVPFKSNSEIPAHSALWFHRAAAADPEFNRFLMFDAKPTVRWRRGREKGYPLIATRLPDCPIQVTPAIMFLFITWQLQLQIEMWKITKSREKCSSCRRAERLDNCGFKMTKDESQWTALLVTAELCYWIHSISYPFQNDCDQKKLFCWRLI